MKKGILVALTLAPVAAGYLINRMILQLPQMSPMVGMAAPWLLLVFWFFLASRYAKTDWKFLPALLIGNAVGILSLGLYLWQFLLVSAEARNLTIAAFSQMNATAVPIRLFVKLAMLLESQPGYAGQTTGTALQVIALVVMMAVFAAGYLWGKKQWKKSA